MYFFILLLVLVSCGYSVIVSLGNLLIKANYEGTGRQGGRQGDRESKECREILEKTGRQEERRIKQWCCEGKGGGGNAGR